MPMMEPTFTVAEAAVATNLDVKEVNKAIDAGIVKATGQDGKRMLTVKGLVSLRLERALAGSLKRDVRKVIIHEIMQSQGTPRRLKEPYRAGEALVVDVPASRSALAQGLRRLHRAKRMVVCDPEVMGGSPVIRGTRIPVHDIADMRKQGASVAEVLKGYPALSEKNVDDAVFYARAFPRKGRPRNAAPWGKRTPTLKTVELPE